MELDIKVKKQRINKKKRRETGCSGQLRMWRQKGFCSTVTGNSCCKSVYINPTCNVGGGFAEEVMAGIGFTMSAVSEKKTGGLEGGQ